MMKRFLKQVCCGVALILSGCGFSQLHITLQGSTILNLNEHQESLPVVVNIYQLKDCDGFLSAPFEALWKEPQGVLGEDLLDQHAVILTPGGRKNLHIRRVKEAQAIAAIAIFRQPSSQHWKVCQKIFNPLGFAPTPLRLNLMHNHITVRS